MNTRSSAESGGGLENSIGPNGLPTRSRTTLAYHEPTRTVVAHVQPLPELPPRKRLFFRWAADSRYQPVALCPDNISIDSFAVETAGSSLFFLTHEWKTVRGKKAASGHWDGLYCFDLNEHRAERLIGRGDLRPPAGVDETWLCTILSPGNGGGRIFCKAALMTQQCANYWICELELAGMRLKPITRLEAVFA